MAPEADLQQKSFQLSSVMADIGVTGEIKSARRRTWLEVETMKTLLWRIRGLNWARYIFGSQSEGTTTVALNSDIDNLRCYYNTRIISDISEWKSGMDNFILHKKPTMYPGYRCLIPLRRDEAIPLTDVPEEDSGMYVHGEDDIVYLSQTHLHIQDPTGTIHGPAWTSHGKNGNRDEDFVRAYHFPHWPEEAQDWVERRKNTDWPPNPLKTKIINSGCFVVPVGHKQSSGESSRIEYRLSTTMAERLIMFDLNITQIRCLILLKLLMKTHLNEQYKNYMKTFYLKTALLYVTEEHNSGYWQDYRLFELIVKCLRWLHSSFQSNNCPHYFIPSLNMFEGRIDIEIRENIAHILKGLMEDPLNAVYEVELDDIGCRLQSRIGTVSTQFKHVRHEIEEFIASRLLGRTAGIFVEFLKEITKQNNPETFLSMLNNAITTCDEEYTKGDSYMMAAVQKLRPMLWATLGAFLSSQLLKQCKQISDTAMNWFKQSRDKDFPQGLLKYTTVLLCDNKTNDAEAVLREIEVHCNTSCVQTVCKCYGVKQFNCSEDFLAKSIDRINKGILHKHCVYCVIFTRFEKFCICDELHYELERSTAAERLLIEDTNAWMEWACVDFLPYLYFLQYKTYKQINHRTKCANALRKLAHCIETGTLYHKETALNILGQCYETENQPCKAKQCYQTSLQIRSSYNAARAHNERLTKKYKIRLLYSRISKV